METPQRVKLSDELVSAIKAAFQEALKEMLIELMREGIRRSTQPKYRRKLSNRRKVK